MRALAAVLALVLLLGGIVSPCPACFQAEAEPTMPDAHACCRKAASMTAAPAEFAAAPADMPAPEEAGPEGQSPDCAKWALHRVWASFAAQPLDLAPQAAADLQSGYGMVTAVGSPVGNSPSIWRHGLHDASPPSWRGAAAAAGMAPLPLRI